MAAENLLELLDILSLSGKDKLPNKLRNKEADNNISNKRNIRINKISDIDEADELCLDRYAVSLLAWHCMPTLFHIKPASLVQIRKRAVGKISELIAIIKGYAEAFSCCCSCLYESESAVSLLVYNRQMLKELLADREVKEYLMSCGYSLAGSNVANLAKKQDIVEEQLEAVLDCWKQRYAEYFSRKQKACLSNGSMRQWRESMRLCRESMRLDYSDLERSRTVFPHEIGLLLGYPLKDVKAFIENSGKNYLLSGYWKVYHDKERALEIFDAYTKVRRYTLEKLKEGIRFKDISTLNKEDISDILIRS